jgi:WD40 repeat protein
MAMRRATKPRAPDHVQPSRMVRRLNSRGDKVLTTIRPNSCRRPLFALILAIACQPARQAPQIAAPVWKAVPPSDTALQAAVASPDGRRVAVLTVAGELVVWQVAPRRELARWVVPGPMPIHSYSGTFPLVFDDAGEVLALGGEDGRVRVWRVDPPEAVAAFVPMPPGTIRVRANGDSAHYFGRFPHSAIAFAPGRPLLAVGGSDGSVTLWDFLRGVPVDSARVVDDEEHSVPIYKLAFSPVDGSLLVADWNGVIRRFQPGTWRERWRVATARRGPTLLAASSTGTLLAYAGISDTVSVLNASTGEEICQVEIQGASSASFADSDYLAVGDGRSGVTVMDPRDCRSVRLTPMLAGTVRGVWFTSRCAGVVAALNVSPKLYELKLPAGWARC